MNPIVPAAFGAALTLTSALSAHAGDDSANVIMNRTLHGYQQLLSQRDQWINHWMPAATGSQPHTGASADQRMVAIIASYTREVLDRGGWVNSVLTNSEYASGNPLLSARVGEGLSLRVTLDVVTRPTTVAARNTPNLNAFDQSQE